METVNAPKPPEPPAAEARPPAPAPDGAALPALPAGGRYIVTGGGTGGHVYPAIAIADEIRRRDPSATFRYVGVRGRSEETIVPRRGYPLTFVRSAGWPGGKNPIKLGVFALALGLGILRSVGLLLSFRPTLIIGTGGYVSAPIMLAAIGLRRLGLIKASTFIHEQNTFPGRLNKLVGQRVDCVGVSFPETLKHFPGRGVYVGYPVRREVGEVDRAAARAALGIPEGKQVVFAFGGSQGARTINRALVDALPQLLNGGDVFVIHGCGAYKGPGYDAARDTADRLAAAGLGGAVEGYLREPYFHNIEQIYAAADLVVCRAGAGTLTEVCARGLPAIIIPKAGLPGDHQVKNARSLASRGAARVVYERVDPTTPGDEEEVSGADLADAILSLLADPGARAQLGAAARHAYIADALDQIAGALARLARGEAVPADPPPAPTGRPDLEARTATGLTVLLRHARNRRQDLMLDADDLAYLRYRADRCLASPRWLVRNDGVKLVGMLGYQERRDLIIALLEERKPVGTLQRLMGGDFVQVGFLRRNAYDALADLDVMDDALARVLHLGLSDGYFEVRSASARCAGHFADRLGSHAAAVEARLFELLDDPWFEVKIAAIRALGRVARERPLVQALESLSFDPNWKVRQAVVVAIQAQLSRGRITPAEARAAVEGMLITSNGFVPNFPLKGAVRELGAAIAAASQPPPDLLSPPAEGQR